MTPEQIQAIVTAAKADDGATLQRTLAALEKAAMDRAAGVEDVTAGLRKKNEELIAKLSSYGSLGAVEELAAKVKELDTLKSVAEQTKLKAEAEKVGANSEQVEALANERANAKFKAMVAEWSAKTEKLETGLKARSEAQEALEKKLHAALLDHELYKVAGPDVDPVLWPYFRETASPFFKPRTNGSETPWWAADRVEFDLIDPQSGARLTNEAMKPMAPQALVDGRKGGEWSAFFVPKGRGAGTVSQSDRVAGPPTDFKSPASAYAAGVFK